MKTRKGKYDITHLTLPTISKKQWDRYTAKTKRVKLALDVLARLAAGAIKQVRGAYFSALDQETIKKIEEGGERFNEFTRVWEETSDNILVKSAKELVTAEACQACAKGACMIAWVANFNEKTVEELNEFQGDLPEEFEDFFPEELWNAIEAAFENGHWSLKRVMNNIVENKGDFVYKGLKYTDDGIKEKNKSGKWVFSDEYGAELNW